VLDPRSDPWPDPPRPAGSRCRPRRGQPDITAEPGPGNLLGNLLCAVVGLLDGGPLAGLLGQLQTLLNQILAALNLGV
jgi:hypothetical protein